MEINYYEHIKKHLEERPYDKDDNKDGNRNYIHQTNVFVVVEELNRLREKIKTLEEKCRKLK